MDKILLNNRVEIWGGIECSINRVGDRYMDQTLLSGHYTREDDIQRFAALGISAMRYPVLWEKHAPEPNREIDWFETERKLNELRKVNLTPIAGLVHHGSGPAHTSFHNDTFSEGLALYAEQVARKFPWLEYYTPVNEPLTTARFCGLYGHWFPHGNDDSSFLRVLIAECKGTILAMQAIRKINPHAKLVFTEDLGKTHSTPKLKYQADFENLRRWLSIDLVCGAVNISHPLYKYILDAGIGTEELAFFTQNPCPPDILGFNHYLTSERYIDEQTSNYPPHTWGGNIEQQYADVEAVRVEQECMSGPYELLKEAWERYHLALAVTEVHLHCSREEQLRWFHNMWETANRLKQEGVEIRAITAWALLGSFDWVSLLTRQNGYYESGVFDLRAASPRPTALSKLITTLSQGKTYAHPVLAEKGWWQRPCRIEYRSAQSHPQHIETRTTRPIIITGKSGSLGKAFARICDLRGIHYHLMGRQDFRITAPAAIEDLILQYNPWAIINTAGFVRVDEAESDAENCFMVNSIAPRELAKQCSRYDVKFVTFSSDLVFDGKKNDPYVESDTVSPLSIFGQSKAAAEKAVLAENPDALVIRTSTYFGPWDSMNFVADALYSFQKSLPFKVVNDVIVSPTYTPDLVNVALDLLLDEEHGIWNISNNGELSWAVLAEEVAKRSGYSTARLNPISLKEMGFVAPRPQYSVLKSEKGFTLPNLENALDRFFHEQELVTI
ncbi:NAD-dependent epimerase/dehydratase family protein [Segetibacter sp. 3557_3]|uniref:SDR family oxidoreductase n=1 Tax=Segetibacter sp. 3557_3 TaxID=2547429 RepID=UPI0010588611|nr:SDR family oxidoreductase [Segetibacter sp. 3557_3]TDH21441.1 NAD-dependent epimerase/dehydratase family protein [Segetibacter sp. 3557_3]